MRRALTLLLFLLFLGGSSAMAQPAISVRGNVGAAFFQSPEGLNTVLNSGVDVGLGTGIEVYRGLEVVVEGSYDRFTFNGDNFALVDEELSVGTEVRGGGFNVLNATVGLRYTFWNASDAHPYISGGAGVYHSVLERAVIPQTDRTLARQATTGVGYHAALGSKFRISDTYSFFFEPRFVIVDTEGTDLETSTSTRYVTVRLGVDVRL